jgi:hypothetical protein
MVMASGFSQMTSSLAAMSLVRQKSGIGPGNYWSFPLANSDETAVK